MSEQGSKETEFRGGKEIIYRHQAHFGYLYAGLQAVAGAKDSKNLFGDYPNEVLETFGEVKVTYDSQDDIYRIKTEEGRSLTEKIRVSQEFLKKLFQSTDSPGESLITQAQSLILYAMAQDMGNYVARFGDLLLLSRYGEEKKKEALKRMVPTMRNFLPYAEGFAFIAPSIRSRFDKISAQKDFSEWDKKFVDTYKTYFKGKNIFASLLEKRPSAESLDPEINQIWEALSSSLSGTSEPDLGES